MPASRSRTDHWWDCLKKIQERGGAIEISVSRGLGHEPDDESCDVIWRVRLVSLGEDGMVVEPPAVFGQTISLLDGVRLVGAMTVGQNRWMFHTRAVGVRPGRPGENLVRLSLPERVERCSRRGFYRTSTADLRLPQVQCWPLLDPSSVIAAETANRIQITDRLDPSGAGVPPAGPDGAPEPLLLPEVGPMFPASLVNLSGGGLGLLVTPDESAALQRRPHLWLRVDLTPEIPAPIAVTARLAHTHIDSAQNIYAGMAFEFAFNPPHRRFVSQAFADYAAQMQARQRRALAG